MAKITHAHRAARSPGAAAAEPGVVQAAVTGAQIECGFNAVVTRLVIDFVRKQAQVKAFLSNVRPQPCIGGSERPGF